MYYNKTDKPASVDPAKFGLDKTDKVEWPPLKRFTGCKSRHFEHKPLSEQLLCGLGLAVEMLAP